MIELEQEAAANEEHEGLSQRINVSKPKMNPINVDQLGSEIHDDFAA